MHMLKRYARLFAYLLLVLLPLQSMAAAHMLVCNSMIHTQAYHSAVNTQNEAESMPCHEHMASKTASNDNSKHCKDTCGALCASLCALTALSGNTYSFLSLHSSTLVSPAEQSYASVTLPNSQRPPIFLS